MAKSTLVLAFEGSGTGLARYRRPRGDGRLSKSLRWTLMVLSPSPRRHCEDESFPIGADVLPQRWVSRQRPRQLEQQSRCSHLDRRSGRNVDGHDLPIAGYEIHFLLWVLKTPSAFAANSKDKPARPPSS